MKSLHQWIQTRLKTFALVHWYESKEFISFWIIQVVKRVKCKMKKRKVALETVPWFGYIKSRHLKSVPSLQDKLMKGFWTISISRRRAKNVLIPSFLTSSHCLTNLWDTRLGLALRYSASYRLVFSTIISISSSVIKTLDTSKAWRPSRSLTYTPRSVVNSATIGQMSNLCQVFSKSFF